MLMSLFLKVVFRYLIDFKRVQSHNRPNEKKNVNKIRTVHVAEVKISFEHLKIIGVIYKFISLAVTRSI